MLSDHNLQIKESDYRDLDLPSYSMLAAIAKEGVEVVTGVKSNMFQLKFGSLVDDMCFEPQRVKDKYFQGKVSKAPTGNPRKILDVVADELLAKIGTNNPFVKVKLPSTKLEDHRPLLVQAADDLGVYKSYNDDKIMSTLAAHKQYFRDKIKSTGKIHISQEMWDLAEVTAYTLATHPFSRDYFNPTEDREIFYQFKFVTKVAGKKVKGMLDCVVADHKNKVIYPVDLKTGEVPVGQFDSIMLHHKYYIQAGLYRKALINIVNADPDLAGYRVSEFEFLYISKSNPYKPLVWVMPEKLYNATLYGFKDVYGFNNKGVFQLLEEYYDCKENQQCLYPREVLDNNGRVMLDNILKE